MKNDRTHNKINPFHVLIYSCSLVSPVVILREKKNKEQQLWKADWW